MKTAYLGIDFMLPVLQAVLREGCEVMRIFTCPTDNVTEFNTAVLRTARRYGIPYTLRRITADDLEELQAAGCELLICAGYYYRIPVSDTLPMVNVHPSPLPLGRGPWPMPVILLRGLPFGGVTIHKITEDFDSGDILLKKSFPIREGETLQTYMEQLYALVPGLIHRLVMELPGLLKQASPQGKGDYWPSPEEPDWTVTMDMGTEQADRILRAFYGYECVYRAGNRRFEIIGGRAVSGDSRGRPFPVYGGYIEAERVREL